MEPRANPIAEKIETIVRGCEVVGGTVQSGWKFHARGARAKVQQAILGLMSCVAGRATHYAPAADLFTKQAPGVAELACCPRQGLAAHVRSFRHGSPS